LGKASAILLTALENPIGSSPNEILSEEAGLSTGPGFANINNKAAYIGNYSTPASGSTPSSTIGSIKNIYNLNQKYSTLTNYIFLIKNMFELICENLLSFRDQLIYNILDKVDPSYYDKGKCCGRGDLQTWCYNQAPTQPSLCDEKLKEPGDTGGTKQNPYCFWAKTDEGGCPDCDPGPDEKSDPKYNPNDAASIRGRCWKKQSTTSSLTPRQKAQILIPPEGFFDGFINEIAEIINNQCQNMYNQFDNSDIINKIRVARRDTNTYPVNDKDPKKYPTLVINIRTFFENFQNFIINNKYNEKLCDLSTYIKKGYYTDINNIIKSIINYWIPLYNSESKFLSILLYNRTIY